MNNQFSVKRPVTFYEQIYDSIKSLILKGVYKPGDRIYEAKIAREFNISRSPVREAVRALEIEGLLVIDEKSRITVYKPSMKDVEDIYQCRMALESLAAGLATRLATDEELQIIEKTLNEVKSYLEENEERDNEVLINLNGEFHELIMHFSKNKRLEKQLLHLRSLIQYYRTLNFRNIGEEDRGLVMLEEHSEIFDEMIKRNEKKASALMAEHISNDLIHLKTLMSMS